MLTFPVDKTKNPLNRKEEILAQGNFIAFSAIIRVLSLYWGRFKRKMRRPSTKLFQLIKSLNKAEILNFRAFASRRKGEKVYMLLFDAILEMTEYDEEALKEQFKTEKFIRHLYKTKNYLYKIILDSLADINQEDEYQLYAQIQKIIILIMKSLYSHAESIFPQAYAIAEEQENFEAARILLSEERNLIKAKDASPELNQRLNEIKNRELELAEKSYNLMQYTHLLDRANALQRQPPDQRRQGVEEILKNPLMKEDRQFRSVSARILYWLILGKVNQTQGKFEMTMKALENAARLYETHPTMVSESISFLHFLDVLENLVVANLIAKNYDRVEEIGRKIKDLAKEEEKGRFLLLERYYYVMIAYMQQANVHDLGDEIIPEYRAFLREYEGRINRKYQILISFILSDHYLLTGRPDESLFWLHHIMNEKDDSIRPDIHQVARILNLVGLLDSGEYKFVGNSIRSAREYLRKVGRWTPAEKVLMKYFQKMADAHALPDESRKVVREFHGKLMAMSNTLEFRKVNGYFNFIHWLERKMEASK